MNKAPLMKNMTTDALKAYADDLQDTLHTAVALKQRNIGWMMREFDIACAILRKREREARSSK